MPTFRAILIILALTAAALLLYVTYFTADRPPSAQENSKALIGGPFTMVDHHGEIVTDADFKDSHMLIYFGYTYCPDICPMELQAMADALDLLPGDVLAKITPLFITVDPERDTVDVMAEYVPHFHPRMVGLTGSRAQVDAVKKAYRVYAAREAQPEGADPEAYLMGHSSYIYLMDRNGDYVTHFRSQTPPAEMAQRLMELVK